MSASQRNKGASAERELARALSGFLNLKVKRNLLQTRDAGHDLTGLPFALEVKRQEKLSVGAWWQQACKQARACGKPPVLAYRQSRKPWRFVVPTGLLGHLSPSNDLTYTAEVGVEVFCELVLAHCEPSCFTKTA